MKRGEPGCMTCNGYGFYYHSDGTTRERERCYCVIKFCPMSLSMDHKFRKRKTDRVCEYCGLIKDSPKGKEKEEVGEKV